MASNSKKKKAEKKATLEEKPVSSKQKENQVFKKHLILLVVKILFLVLICFIVFGVIFGFTRMNDSSMSPNIKNGDLIVYYRLENRFSNGDAVVVDRGEGLESFRIVALPGQVVDIDKDGNLLIDGQPSTVETFFETKKDEKAVIDYPHRIPEGYYFVMNDDRRNTNDSRAFGEIIRDKIKGRIITKIQIRDL